MSHISQSSTVDRSTLTYTHKVFTILVFGADRRQKACGLSDIQARRVSRIDSRKPLSHSSSGVDLI
jgi:hypothetical protein